MVKILTSKERGQLKSRHKMARDKRLCDRIKAVLAYDDGYLKEKKLTTSSGGSDGKLTDQESSEIIEHLKEITYLYVKDICHYVLQTYGKKYSISGMTKWLHSCDFCYKKPHAVPAKADKVLQKKFIQYYARLKKKAGVKEPIYFTDNVHPQHQTQLTYGWIIKGVRKEIATTAYQKRLNIIGGICLNGHRFTFQQADTVNAETICDFLWKLRQANPGKFFVHVIWDNARYHRNNEVKEFAKELGIKLHYLPPYSPNLNSVERVWKLMHESVRYNQYYGQYYGKFFEFTDATLGFFKGIGRKKCILRERITDNFQIIHSPLLA